MPRRRRSDFPGSWHHVTNRGIARRTIFEDRVDIRRFLALVAREVRARRIEVHAYCVMTTHFHMLVVSPEGRLHDAMRQIEGLYARWFNRARRRDGSLYRGRYRSIPVESNEHRSACLAYIDANPVEAHVVTSASAYPWGSASNYSRRRGPPWLTRGRVEAMVADRGCLPAFDPARYEEIVSTSWSPELKTWIERTITRRALPDPNLDDLVGSAPDAVRAWMDRKARLADGTRLRTTALPSATVLAAVECEFASCSDWRIVVRGRRRAARDAMRVGLLRACAGATIAEVAALEKIGVSSVPRREEWHREAMRSDAKYARVAVRAIETASRRTPSPT